MGGGVFEKTASRNPVSPVGLGRCHFEVFLLFQSAASAESCSPNLGGDCGAGHVMVMAAEELEGCWWSVLGMGE